MSQRALQASDAVAFRRRVCCILIGLLLLGALSACGAEVAADQSDAGIGGNLPETVAASFFEDFNSALNDPDLSQGKTQRAWAERLANYFAPVERAGKRRALGRMLASFAYNQRQLGEGQRIVFEITYTNIEVVDRSDDRATVRLLDGKLRLQRVRERDNGDREVLRQQETSLTETLGQTSGVFPVLRVNGRWFMTEN